MSVTEESYTPATWGVRKDFTKKVVCELTLESVIREDWRVGRPIRKTKQHVLLHKWGEGSGASGEWYRAPSLIKIIMRERPIVVEQTVSGSHSLR